MDTVNSNYIVSLKEACFSGMSEYRKTDVFSDRKEQRSLLNRVGIDADLSLNDLSESDISSTHAVICLNKGGTTKVQLLYSGRNQVDQNWGFWNHF